MFGNLEYFLHDEAHLTLICLVWIYSGYMGTRLSIERASFWNVSIPKTALGVGGNS
jgi:hypothetical protein